MSRPQNRIEGSGLRREQGEPGERGSGPGAAPHASPLPSDAGQSVKAGRAGCQRLPSSSRTLSSSSSGYFSFDSEPSSPLMTHSTATQTPSPSSQVITHALQRFNQARMTEFWPTLHSHDTPHGAASAGDMQAELFVAQELRHIGDEFNRLYFQREGRIVRAAHQPPQNQPIVIVQWMRFLCRRLLQMILRQR